MAATPTMNLPTWLQWAAGWVETAGMRDARVTRNREGRAARLAKRRRARSQRQARRVLRRSR